MTTSAPIVDCRTDAAAGGHSPASRGSANFVRLFQPRFARLVEAGTKLHTVRATPKRMPKVGDRISLREWTGKPYRSKQRVLLESTITKLQKIEIVENGWTWLDDVRMKTLRDCNDFAHADGFVGYSEMLAWFRDTHGLPFAGIVIHWQNAEVSASGDENQKP